MSQELLYTSAPRGLKPGSRGFCTVLSTQGMAAPLATALESLSGYRPVYAPSDERASLNPIAWSHLKVQVAGKSCHVLSRVADYGLDYSQRTNKLAHHVVLDPVELTESGPAHLLLMPQFMRTGWDEEPRVVPPKPPRKVPAVQGGLCHAWKDVTGDAGWAGVLAESYLKDPERPVFLLFEPGYELLPLLAESISLLPPDRRWDVTFSTYFSGLPQGVGCTWRCLLKDSPEARQAVRFVKALRLDLTAPSLGAASGGDLVELARGATRPAIALTPDSQTGDAADLPEEDQELQSDNSALPVDGAEQDALQAVVEAEKTEIPPFLPNFPLSFSDTHLKPPRVARRSKRTLSDVEREWAARRRRWQFVFVGIVALSLFVTAGFLVVRSRTLLAPLKPETSDLREPSKKAEPQPPQPPVIASSVVSPKPAASSHPTATPDRSPATNTEAVVLQPMPQATASSPTPNDKPVQAAVDKSSIAQAASLPITPEVKTISAYEALRQKAQDTPKPIQLAKIPKQKLNEVKLELLGPKNSPLVFKESRNKDKLTYDCGMLGGSDRKQIQSFCTLTCTASDENVVVAIKPGLHVQGKKNALGWNAIDIHTASHGDTPFARIEFLPTHPFEVSSPIELTVKNSFRETIPPVTEIGSVMQPELKLDRASLIIGNQTLDVISDNGLGRCPKLLTEISKVLNNNAGKEKEEVKPFLRVSWHNTNEGAPGIRFEIEKWDEYCREIETKLKEQSKGWVRKAMVISKGADGDQLSKVLTLKDMDMNKLGLPKSKEILVVAESLSKDTLTPVGMKKNASSPEMTEVQMKALLELHKDLFTLGYGIELQEQLNCVRIDEPCVYYELYNLGNTEKSPLKQYLLRSFTSKR